MNYWTLFEKNYKNDKYNFIIYRKFAILNDTNSQNVKNIGEVAQTSKVFYKNVYAIRIRRLK